MKPEAYMAYISARLIDIHTALVEKTGEQPFLEPCLRIGQDCACTISLYRAYNDGEYRIETVKADSIEGALDAADAFIVAMPDADEVARQDAHKAVAKAIEQCEAIPFPAEVMTPLRAGMDALSSNLLTYDAGRGELLGDRA